jgi:hypothetical protein
VKEDLGASAVRIERGVDYVEATRWVPSRSGGIPLERVPALTRNPPSFTVERFPFQRIEGV